MIFLDGVGLGNDDAAVNPFAAGDFPTLHTLTNGERWSKSTPVTQSKRAIFVPTDPRLSVSGRPQSATGQATILTGRNISALIGEHYGPKPDERIRQLLDQDNVFLRLRKRGKSAAMLEAYPSRYHRGIARGKLLPASYQYAAQTAQIPLMTDIHLRDGDALSGDWTAQGWHTQLGYNDIPILTPRAAGIRLVELALRSDFAFFSHWMTDVVGHRGKLDEAVNLLQTFDQVMAGVLEAWDDAEGLVIITSDHGNIEDMSHGKHTTNDVPTIIIGNQKETFAKGLRDLTHITPRLLDAL